MDVQTLLVGLGVFVISALLIWLITSLTVRERPFEERMAQQMQMEKELLFLDGKQGAHSTGSKKDKSKKKQSKKTKAPGEQDISGSSAEKALKGNKVKTVKLLELEIDPTVIETALDEPPEVVGKSRASKTATTPTVAGKPILTNKSEKLAVRKEDQAPELVHHRAVPKDAVELKHDREKLKASHQLLNKDASEVNKTLDRSAPAKSVPEKVKEKVDTIPVVPTDTNKASSAINGNSSGTKLKKQKVQHEEIKADVIVKTQVDQIGTAAPAPITLDPSSKKKNKVVPTSTESSVSVSIDVIIAALHRGPLNVDETRQLIDILTSRQFADNGLLAHGQEVTKKGQRDPVSAVTQQLEEKRKEIEEEKHRTAIASQKVNDLELELSDLRQKMAALAKQNYDQLNGQRQENAAMAGHIKQLESSAVTMRNQYENLKAQWTTSHNELQRITTENHHLATQNKHFTESETSLEEMRTKVKIMEDALKSNAMQYNACENAKKSLESKVKHLEEQVSFMDKSLRDSQIVAKHYSEAPEELRKAELRNKNLNVELERLNIAVQHLEKDLALKQDETKLGENKLHDISRQKSELEGRLRLADTQTAELVSTLKLRDSEVQALKAELNEVSSELKVVRERPVKSNDNIREETITKSEEPLLFADPLGSGAKLLENGTAVEHERLHLQELDAIRDKFTVEIETLKHDRTVLETSKKEGDSLNKSLLEKVNELEQERTKVESSLSENLKELAEIQTRLNKKELEFTELESRLRDKEVELSNALSHVSQNMNGSADVSSTVEQKDAALADVESRLQQKESDHSILVERLHKLETEHSSLRNTLKNKEAELTDVGACLRQLESEYADVNERIRLKDSESSDIEVNLSHLKSQLELKNAELDEHRSRLLVIEANTSSLESALREKESQLADSTANFEVLKGQLNSVTVERNDIQIHLLKSQELIGSLQSAQTESSLVNEDLDKYAKQVKDLQTNLDGLNCENAALKEAIQRMQSDLQQAADNKKSLQEVEKDASSRQQVTDNLLSELNRTKESENVLLMQIQHYKDVLSDTESILKRLQETVELEEQKSLQKLLLLEADLQKTREELSVLREDMKGMHRTSECFIGALTPAVDHSECMLRKDLSPVSKHRSLTELTGKNDTV